MAGTIEGGKATAETNKRKYGEDYYKKIGAMGGKKLVPKGFATMDKAKLAEIGRKGGLISRRGKSL